VIVGTVTGAESCYDIYVVITSRWMFHVESVMDGICSAISSVPLCLEHRKLRYL